MVENFNTANYYHSEVRIYVPIKNEMYVIYT